MDIVVDSKIPFFPEKLFHYGFIRYMEGKSITACDLKNTEALLIRTRTRCDEKLLDQTGVKFIGSATIGTDHIDLDYCRQRGIEVAHAPGSNAAAVMQYVITCLIDLSVKKNINLSSYTLGIIGVGNIGRLVAEAAKSLNMNVLLNDPPREAREGSNGFTHLYNLLRQSDIVTLHIPLKSDTYGFAGKSFFDNLKTGAWLVNTSRGEVVNEDELIRNRYKLGALVLDVWQNEPQINTRLLDITDLATPHIAGYSIQGKRRASEMILQSLAQWCGEEEIPVKLPICEEKTIPVVIPSQKKSELEKLLFAVEYTFPVRKEDSCLRTQPAKFEELRNNYALRNDFSAYMIISPSDPFVGVCQKLGFGHSLLNVL